MNPITELRMISCASDYNLRLDLINHWIQKNLVTISQNQYIVNKKVLSTDQNDLIFEHLAKGCAEEMINNGVALVNCEKSLYTVEIMALKHGKQPDSE